MPKKTAELIINGKNHYILQLKGSQIKLNKAAKTAVVSQSYDTFKTSEKGHGRHSEWIVECYEVSNIPAMLPLIPDWKGLATLVRVRRKVVHTKKCPKAQSDNYDSDSHYISSLIKPSALDCFNDIRGHWAIENGLHYEKDVVMREDSNRISETQPAVNMAVFNTIAINYLRQLGFKGIHDAQISFGYNFKELYFNIRT